MALDRAHENASTPVLNVAAYFPLGDIFARQVENAPDWLARYVTITYFRDTRFIRQGLCQGQDGSRTSMRHGEVARFVATGIFSPLATK